jgi:phospholipid transport system substrate-binding protein
MIKTVLSVLLTALLLAVTPAMAAGGPEAEALVKQAAADAASAFAGGPFSRDVAHQKVAALVNKYGDIAYESELILGRHWRKAGQAQKDAFSSLLIPFFVATYAELIDNKSGSTQVEVLSSEERADGVLVKARMILSAEDSVILAFVVTRSPSGRLVITDVIAEGAGLLTTIRSDFTSVIRNAGGNIEVLLDAMRKKIDSVPK